MLRSTGFDASKQWKRKYTHILIIIYVHNCVGSDEQGSDSIAFAYYFRIRIKKLQGELNICFMCQGTANVHFSIVICCIFASILDFECYFSSFGAVFC